MIGIGVVALEEAKAAGWTILGITVAAQIAVWAATAWVGAPDRQPGRRWPLLWRWIVRFCITLVVIAFLAAAWIGFVHSIDRVGEWTGDLGGWLADETDGLRDWIF